MLQFSLKFQLLLFLFFVVVVNVVDVVFWFDLHFWLVFKEQQNNNNSQPNEDKTERPSENVSLARKSTQLPYLYPIPTVPRTQFIKNPLAYEYKQKLALGNGA